MIVNLEKTQPINPLLKRVQVYLGTFVKLPNGFKLTKVKYSYGKIGDMTFQFNFNCPTKSPVSNPFFLDTHHIRKQGFVKEALQLEKLPR